MTSTWREIINIVNTISNALKRVKIIPYEINNLTLMEILLSLTLAFIFRLTICLYTCTLSLSLSLSLLLIGMFVL